MTLLFLISLCILIWVYILTIVTEIWNHNLTIGIIVLTSLLATFPIVNIVVVISVTVLARKELSTFLEALDRLLSRKIN